MTAMSPDLIRDRLRDAVRRSADVPGNDVEAMLEYLAALEADARRLDWLDGYPFFESLEGDLNRLKITMRGVDRDFYGATLRAAIDAAREAEKP